MPGLQQMSEDQLFFLSFASVWCEAQTLTALAQQLNTDVHAPALARVTGVLQNFDQFRKISCARALNHLQLGFSENLAVTGFSFWPQTSNCAGSILRKFIEHASPIRQHQPCFPADKIQKDALNFFWEISCSDPFAQLVVQKVQILVRQPLLTLSYNRSVLDIFKFFILQHLGLSPVFIPRSHFSM